MDVEENSSRVKRAIKVTQDTLSNMAKLRSAVALPTEAVLKIREKTISLDELLQSLENYFFSDPPERVEKADWATAGG